METKNCPKCGQQNRADRSVCSECYAQLDGVTSTNTGGPAPRQAAMPKNMASSAGLTDANTAGDSPFDNPPAAVEAQPTPQEGGSPVMGSAPVQKQPGHQRNTPPATSTGQSAPPAKKSGAVGAIIALIVLLIGLGGAAAWWFVIRPAQSAGSAGPEQVIRQFLEIGFKNDIEGSRQYVVNSQKNEIKSSGGKAYSDAEIKQILAQFTFSTPTNEGADTTVITMKAKPGANVPQELKMDMIWVLRREEGVWKVDFDESFGRSFKALMENNKPK